MDDVPDWLNPEFVLKVLKKAENDKSIEIKEMAMNPATAKGDNYTSQMVRISLEYSGTKDGQKYDEKKTIIVKIAPYTEGVHKDLVEKVGLFDTEIKMMETTLKKMNELTKKLGHRLSADVLYTQIGDPSLLVIEDLSPYGFRMADRLAGLDLQHCILALRGLGRFHASSIAVYEKDFKNGTVPYNKGMFNRKHPDEMKRFFTLGMRALGTEILNWSELGPARVEYSEKLLKLADHSYDKAADTMILKEDEFNVINHGDFWVNNMLFRYNDENKVLDHMFVDFQMCSYTSPAIDLLYFLNTSISPDVDLNHRDTILKEYLNTLKESMSKFGCETRPPTMADLKKSLSEREFYGILSACTISPVVLVEKSEAKSLDEIMLPDGGYDNPGYRSPLFRQIMVKKIPEWASRNLFD
ncbi:uncharacterized protein [Venturia canescens]|uniref:uncharacterized protein n=1 Tax=Venturia canescens TaxID=32260 RepID=UPI001C9D363F|nr:uncharacterized protein LOC122415510 [Venturia canescens]